MHARLTWVVLAVAAVVSLVGAATASAKVVTFEDEVKGLSAGAPGVINLRVTFSNGKPTKVQYNFNNVYAQCPGTGSAGSGGANVDVKVDSHGEFKSKVDNDQPDGSHVAHTLTGKVASNGKSVKGKVVATVPFGGVQCNSNASYNAKKV